MTPIFVFGYQALISRPEFMGPLEANLNNIVIEHNELRNLKITQQHQVGCLSTHVTQLKLDCGSLSTLEEPIQLVQTIRPTHSN